MAKEEKRYWVFMIRLYRSGDAELAEWRASLEDPHTGERFNFATLEALFSFLKNCTQNTKTVEAPS